MNRVLLLALLGVIALLAGCEDATEPGRAAWTRGDLDTAHVRFHDALARRGEQASAALCYDAAWTAWRRGEARLAGELAARAEARAEVTGERVAGAAAAALRARLAWERGQALAGAPSDDIVAREQRVASVEEALAAWSRAAWEEGDGPSARNVERALHLLERLRERKAGNARPRPRPLPRPTPAAPPEAAPRAEDAELPGAAATALTEEDLARLSEVLAAKEAEKAALRAKERARQGAQVERDW
ncbi:MAG: hypothetical protein AB7T63_04950 [Planctomycetota bacterium]